MNKKGGLNVFYGAILIIIIGSFMFIILGPLLEGTTDGGGLAAEATRLGIPATNPTYLLLSNLWAIIPLGILIAVLIRTYRDSQQRGPYA